MRTRHLIYSDIIRLMGGAESAAKRLGKEKGTVDKYMQLPAPEGSGREMPVDTLTDFLALAREFGDPAMPPLLSELVNDHFANPAGLKAIGSEVLQHINVGIAALNNGGHLKSSGASCPACRTPLQRKGWFDGAPIYSCPHCHGAGERAPQ